MNEHHRPRDCGRTAGWLWLLLALVMAAGAGAQEPDADQTPPLNLDLDLYALLTAEDVVSGSAEDAIWVLHPAPGRKLLQLPLNYQPADEPVDLTSTSLKVRGGRLLAWRLIESREKAPAGSLAERQIEMTLSETAPRITRKLTVNPDGSLEWSMDRVIPGGEVKKVDWPYALRINPLLLRERHPGDVPRISRQAGETESAYYARRQRTLSEHRTRVEEYLRLQKSVMSLPTNFKIPEPERIWAVVELGDHVTDLVISGLSTGSWSIGLDQLNALRLAAARRLPAPVAANTGFPNDTVAAVGRMADLIRANQHPYTFRAVAFALSYSGLAPYTRQDDILYRLIAAIIAGPDTTARNVMVKEVARTFPPTEASVNLSKLALSSLDPSVQLEALSGILSTDASDPQQLQEMIQETNRLLASETGPSPEAILGQLLPLAVKRPNAVGAIASNLRLASLSPRRLEQAVVFIVRNAATDPLAYSVLNQGLLGATDPALVRKTLEVLNAAQSADSPVKSVVSSALDRLLKPAAKTNSSAGQEVLIEQPIQIASTNHSLFRVLQSTDPQIRGLAWEALRHFEFPPPAADQIGQALQQDLYSAVVDAALGQPPTPVQVAEFLNHQPDTLRVTAGLTRLVVRGGGETATRAGRMLLGSNRPLAEVLNSLAFTERQEFANGMYRGQTGTTPLVTALLRQRVNVNPLATWFGQQVAAGRLPEASEWAAIMGGEDRLVDLVAASDGELAQGAVAALVAQAGGDERMARNLAQNLRNQPDQSRAGIAKNWQQARTDIHLLRVRQIAGPNRMTLRVYNDRAGTVGGQRQVHTELAVGLVNLRIEGQNVSFGTPNLALSLPETHLAIRINKPAQLKSLPNDNLAQLPLEQIASSLDLRPQADGSWSGTVKMGENTLELSIQPAR